VGFITEVLRIYRWNTGGSQEVLKPWSTELEAPITGQQATSAKFTSPLAIAFDAAGNMLISEYSVCRVWLVDALTGKLKHVAGTGVCGNSINSADPRQTRTYSISSVAFGPGGRTAFLADANLHQILKVVLECVGA
jgi:hypothetical protein